MAKANPIGRQIQYVAMKTGIPRNTLISWERRHKIVTPERCANGYRVYSSSDIRILQRVSRLVQSGQRIGDIARMLRTAQEAQPDELGGLVEIGNQMFDALIAYDLDRAQRLVSRLALTSFEDRITEVYTPILVRVGDLWESGQLTVAQEHFTTTYCRTRLTSMLQQVGSNNHRGRRILAAGFIGERHETGLLTVVLLLALRGYIVTYLGPDVPMADIAPAAESTRSTMVCQSITMVPDPNKIHRQILQLRATLPPDIALAIGGQGGATLDIDAPGVVLCRTVDDIEAMQKGY